MNDPLMIPAVRATANAVVLSKRTVNLWRVAIGSVEEAKKKFLAAYRATLDDAMPGWKTTWQANPQFPKTLMEAEDYMKMLCLENGMERTTFSRYRKAARTSLLMDMPFKLGLEFSIEQLRTMKRSGNPNLEAKKIRQERIVKRAETVLARTAATVLPLPEKGENPLEYIEGISGRLAEYLHAAGEHLDKKTYTKLIMLIHSLK
jgi:hypothetical protein